MRARFVGSALVLLPLAAFACDDRTSTSGRSTTQPAAALAIVFESQEVWVGNDEYETDPNNTYAGRLTGIRAAFDRQLPAKSFPSGSQGALIGYATGAKIIVPMGPIERINGGAFGKQIDYHNVLGEDLAQGVVMGLDELARAPAKRKILVVIGHGTDANPVTATPMLEARLRDAARDGIETFAISYWSPYDNQDAAFIGRFTAHAVNVSSDDALSAALAAIWKP